MSTLGCVMLGLAWAAVWLGLHLDDRAKLAGLDRRHHE